MADYTISKLEPQELIEMAATVGGLSEQAEAAFRNFSNQERTGKRSMAEGREGYARLIGNIALANPNDLNRRDDPRELANKLEYDSALELVRQKTLNFSEKITEMQLANSIDIMTLVDAYASALQSNRDRNSALDFAMNEVDEYNKRFANKVESADDKTEAGDTNNTQQP